MSYDKLTAIFNKIKEYNDIIIFRHFRPDGDCVGSTLGLKEIIKLTYPQKNVYLINNDYSDYLKFLGNEDQDVSDEIYQKSLAIILDTSILDRVSNKKFALCKEIVKIDHHIEITPYGDISWVEEERSSCSEMIAHFYNTFKNELKINSYAATCIYTGIVTDSGRFRFRSVNGETMRLAGMLMDVGIDLDNLYANLYLEDFDYLKFKAYVYNHIKMTKNGVAYLFVDKKMQEKFNLTTETASTSVSFLEGIKGSIIWIAFIENPDQTIRVRLRSRFVTVSELGERYRGGGHACAAGATVYNKKELNALLKEADELIKNYKENNSDWL